MDTGRKRPVRPRLESAADTSRPSGSVKPRCASGLRRAEHGASPARWQLVSAGGALLAAAEQVHLVTFDREAARRLLLAVARTAEPVEHAVAAIAPEVVVMLHARALVTRRLAGQLHLRNRFLIHQALERAVHRGHPQARRRRARLAEDLGRAKRPPRLLEHTVNGLPLRCRSFHVREFSREPVRVGVQDRYTDL